MDLLLPSWITTIHPIFFFSFFRLSRWNGGKERLRMRERKRWNDVFMGEEMKWKVRSEEKGKGSSGWDYGIQLMDHPFQRESDMTCDEGGSASSSSCCIMDVVAPSPSTSSATMEECVIQELVRPSTLYPPSHFFHYHTALLSLSIKCTAHSHIFFRVQLRTVLSCASICIKS